MPGTRLYQIYRFPRTARKLPESSALVEGLLPQKFLGVGGLYWLGVAGRRLRM